MGTVEMGMVEFLNAASNPITFRYEHLINRYDIESGILWTGMNPQGIPCCTPELLEDLYNHHKSIEICGGKVQVGDETHAVHYSVVASLIPGVFNLGGNLELFSRLIKDRKRQALVEYSIRCLDVMFLRMNHFKSSMVTISLVQGDALGGGLEAALTSDVIIAERSAKMGFPEILFNLIPGHGAFSLVARKIGVTNAEKMILSGKLFSAEEMYEMGLVDVLAEDGLGEEAVYDYVEKQARRSNGYIALKKARQRFNPITYQELIDIMHVWVDAALRLSEKDLKVMDRFVRSQQKLFGKNSGIQNSNAIPGLTAASA
ncbi:MAG: crotonase/enoyl-CoA hydratase family protein [Gallionella sp.]